MLGEQTMAHIMQKRLKRSRRQRPAVQNVTDEGALSNQNIEVGGLYFDLELV
jgi:hypothetical protein